MPISLLHDKIGSFFIYPIILILLIAYRIYARRKKHAFRMPVGFFIVYFLLMSVIAILGKFNLAPIVDNLKLIATIFLTLGIIRFITCVIVDYIMRHKGLAPIPTISRDIGLAIVYLFAVLIILRYKTDINLASLITTSAVLSVVIGLALQDTLGNLFSGIVLQMEKPYHIGDWVRFDTYTGKVVGMTWKSTKILTFEKELLCIPNNVIAKSHILNYSQPDPVHIATFEIGVSYKDPPNKVRETILNTLAEHQKILENPPSEVRLIRYNDFSIDYVARFYISDFENEARIKSQILNQLWYRFQREGITIPYPIRTIQHVHKDPEKEATEKGEATRRTMESLRRIDLFSPLSAEDITSLASRVHFEKFAAGEVIIKQGAEGDSMYTIISGECDVIICEEGSKEHIIATLKEDQFFGEMSLLTGEPRTATVRAKTDVTCIKIEKDDIAVIIKAHIAVATAMSEILAIRREDLKSKKEVIREAGRKPDQGLASQILTKIRSFFNI